MTEIFEKQDLKKQDEDMNEVEIHYEAAYKLIDYLRNVSHFTDEQILDLIGIHTQINLTIKFYKFHFVYLLL